MPDICPGDMRIIESMWARIMGIMPDPPMPIWSPLIGMLSIFMPPHDEPQLRVGDGLWSSRSRANARHD
jgi:hypothetical protein